MAGGGRGAQESRTCLRVLSPSRHGSDVARGGPIPFGRRPGSRHPVSRSNLTCPKEINSVEAWRSPAPGIFPKLQAPESAADAGVRLTGVREPAADSASRAGSGRIWGGPRVTLVSPERGAEVWCTDL